MQIAVAVLPGRDPQAQNARRRAEALCRRSVLLLHGGRWELGVPAQW